MLKSFLTCTEVEKLTYYKVTFTEAESVQDLMWTTLDRALLCIVSDVKNSISFLLVTYWLCDHKGNTV